MAGTFEIRDTVLERSCLALHGRTYLMGEREALTHSTLGTIRHGVPESRLNSSGGGGRNRTGVHGFAGLRWIVLDQRPSPDSLSPKRQLSLFGAVVLLGFLRGGESSFPAQLLPVKGRPHVEPSARARSCGLRPIGIATTELRRCLQLPSLSFKVRHDVEVVVAAGHGKT